MVNNWLWVTELLKLFRTEMFGRLMDGYNEIGIRTQSAKLCGARTFALEMLEFRYKASNKVASRVRL